MDSLLDQVTAQLAMKRIQPKLDMGGATAANLSAGAAPTDPTMMPIPDVSLGDPNAPLNYTPGAGKGAGGGKSAKMDAILGLLGAGSEIGAALMDKEPDPKGTITPIDTASMGSAPILGGSKQGAPLDKVQMGSNPYQSAILAMLGQG